LRALDVEVRLTPIASELAGSPPLDRDHEHASYDRDAVEAWWGRARPCGPGAARVPRPLPRQVQPVALLLGQLRSRLYALLGAARTAASRRHPGAAGRGDARVVLARVHQRRLVGGHARGARARARVLRLRLSRSRRDCPPRRSVPPRRGSTPTSRSGCCRTRPCARRRIRRRSSPSSSSRATRRSRTRSLGSRRAGAAERASG
jgi:hypothetical protein